jgi:hypothetical protein
MPQEMTFRWGRHLASLPFRGCLFQEASPAFYHRKGVEGREQRWQPNAVKTEGTPASPGSDLPQATSLPSCTLDTPIPSPSSH